MMGRVAGRLGAAAVATAVFATAAHASGWMDADAESLGRGGVNALQRLDQSPGAWVEAGVRAAFSVEEPYAGTDLLGAAMVVDVSTSRGSAALGVAQLRSPVHHETHFEVGLQVRRGTLRCGVGATLSALTFTGYTTTWGVEPRFGIGAELPVGARLAGTFEFLDRGAGVHQPRIVLAGAQPLATGLDLVWQHEREPGLESRTLLGLTWTHAEVGLQMGYDIATQACTAGAVWSWSRQRLACAARSHADLGWSQCWTYAFEH